jgi:hypothetical protein
LRWPFEINLIEIRNREDGTSRTYSNAVAALQACAPAAGTLLGFMNIKLERIANIILKK